MEPNYNSLFNDTKGLITDFLAPTDLYHLLQADIVLGHTPQADVLMHQCKMNSLRNRLCKTKLGDILPSYIEFAATLPADSFVLSGSIVWQSLLGVNWNSDVDFYCSGEVAERVRTWLMEHTDLLLVNWNGIYTFFDNEDDTDTAPGVNQTIHHVEHYLDMKMLEGELVRDINGNEWRFDSDNIPRIHYVTTLMGDHTNYVISTTQNVPLRVDIRLKKEGKDSDLIVGYNNEPATHMIDGFDMKGCQCYCNGSDVIVTQPTYTLNRQTHLTATLNNSIIIEYIQCINRQCNRSFTWLLHKLWSRLRPPLPTIQWPTHNVNCPGRGLLIFSEELDHHENRDVRIVVRHIRRRLIKTALSHMHRRGMFVRIGASPLEIHNWLIRILFHRIRKYLDRGIEILNLSPFYASVMRQLPTSVEDTYANNV